VIFIGGGIDKGPAFGWSGAFFLGVGVDVAFGGVVVKVGGVTLSAVVCPY